MKILINLLFISVVFGVIHSNRTEAAGSSSFLQDGSQDESKSITSDDFRKRRKLSQSTARAVAPKKRFYRALRPQKNVPPKQNGRASVTETADIGFTFWLLKPVDEDDPAKSLSEVNPGTKESLLARRIGSETVLSIGDKLRIGIESGTSNGYMYVINREKYLDGSYGTARLIFPTRGIRGGNNSVQPGVLTYFPTPPSYFRIDADRDAKQVAEELIVIISPKVLVSPENLSKEQLEISGGQIDEWLKWMVEPYQVELEGGVGETMTETEKSAGVEQKSLKLVSVLSENDAVPQTIYRMKIKKDDPVVAVIELKIKPMP